MHFTIFRDFVDVGRDEDLIFIMHYLKIMKKINFGLKYMKQPKAILLIFSSHKRAEKRKINIEYVALQIEHLETTLKRQMHKISNIGKVSTEIIYLLIVDIDIFYAASRVSNAT